MVTLDYTGYLAGQHVWVEMLNRQAAKADTAHAAELNRLARATVRRIAALAPQRVFDPKTKPHG